MIIQPKPNRVPHTRVKAHHHALKLMGCGFVLTAADADKQLAWDAIRAGIAEIVRIEELISSWKSTSVTHLNILLPSCFPAVPVNNAEM